MPGFDEKDLTELEHALGALSPAPSGFNRDGLMFRAGQQSARGRRHLLWPLATALTTAVAACLGVVLLLQPAPEPAVRIVYVDRVVPEKADSAAPKESPAARGETMVASVEDPSVAFSYWRLQEALVRYGSDELPEAAPLANGSGPAAASVPVPSAWEWRTRPGSPSPSLNAGVE